jgi:hypothetical protein
LDRRLGGPQSRSGRSGEEKILEPTGTRTPTPRSSSPYQVAIPTTLSRLPFAVVRFIKHPHQCYLPTLGQNFPRLGNIFYTRLMTPETSKTLEENAGRSEHCIEYTETWFLEVSVTTPPSGSGSRISIRGRLSSQKLFKTGL